MKKTNDTIMDSQDDQVLADLPELENLNEVQQLESKIISLQNNLINLQNQVLTMTNDIVDVLAVIEKLKDQKNNVGSNEHSLGDYQPSPIASTSKQPSNADQAGPSNSAQPREAKPAERTGPRPEWFIDCSGLLEDMRIHAKAKWDDIKTSLPEEEEKDKEVLKNSILLEVTYKTKELLSKDSYKTLDQFTRDVTSSIERVMSESEEKRMLLDQLGLQDFYDHHVAPIISKYSPSETRTAKRQEESNSDKEDGPSTSKRPKENKLDVQLLGESNSPKSPAILDDSSPNEHLNNEISVVNDDEISESTSDDEPPPEFNEPLNQAPAEQINNENGENRRTTARKNTRNIPDFSNVEYLKSKNVPKYTNQDIIGKVVSHRDLGEKKKKEDNQPYKLFYFFLQGNSDKLVKVVAWNTVYDKVHKKIKKGQVLRLQEVEIRSYKHKNELHIFESSTIHRWTRANEWKVLLLPM